jgi:hypothetical protein
MVSRRADVPSHLRRSVRSPRKREVRRVIRAPRDGAGAAGQQRGRVLSRAGGDRGSARHVRRRAGPADLIRGLRLRSSRRRGARASERRLFPLAFALNARAPFALLSGRFLAVKQWLRSRGTFAVSTGYVCSAAPENSYLVRTLVRVVFGFLAPEKANAAKGRRMSHLIWRGRRDSYSDRLRCTCKLLILRYSHSSESSRNGRDAHTQPTRAILPYSVSIAQAYHSSRRT